MTTSIKEALEPCPFCGSAHLESGGDDKLVGVRCLDCEATGPNHYITGKDWNIRSSVGVSSNAIDALEHARMFIENGVELGYIKLPDADTLDPAHETLGRIKAALATLQPSGERREAIARILYPTAFMGIDEAPPDAHKQRQQSIALGKVDELFASGLVQNEAGEPTNYMIDAGVAFALSVSLSSEYRWSQYVADLYKTMRAAAIRSARNGGAET